MKSIKYTARTALLCLALVMTSCATSDTKLKIVTDASARPDMKPTLHYIPQQKADADGATLPYEARENPYLSQRNKVSKDSVLTFIEGRRAYKSGNFERARTLFSTLTEQDPKISGPWVMLGDIAVDDGAYPLAVRYYAKAIEISPLNVNAYLRLAKAQRLQGHFLHAQNTYATALSVWPDFPEAHLNLAVLYDVYLNHPLRAQKHMEAYQFLTASSNKEVSGWLLEIQQRTGIAPSFQEAPTTPDSLSRGQ